MPDLHPSTGSVQCAPPKPAYRQFHVNPSLYREWSWRVVGAHERMPSRCQRILRASVGYCSCRFCSPSLDHFGRRALSHARSGSQMLPSAWLVWRIRPRHDLNAESTRSTGTFEANSNVWVEHLSSIALTHMVTSEGYHPQRRRICQHSHRGRPQCMRSSV